MVYTVMSKKSPYPQRADILLREYRQKVNKQIYNFSYGGNIMKK